MYVTQHYCTDCLFENDGEIIAKGKTIVQAINNYIKQTGIFDEWEEAEWLEYNYDYIWNDHGDIIAKIQKI